MKQYVCIYKKNYTIDGMCESHRHVCHAWLSSVMLSLGGVTTVGGGVLGLSGARENLGRSSLSLSRVWRSSPMALEGDRGEGGVALLLLQLPPGEAGAASAEIFPGKNWLLNDGLKWNGRAELLMKNSPSSLIPVDCRQVWISIILMIVQIFLEVFSNPDQSYATLVFS